MWGSILRSEQGCTLLAQLGQLKTGLKEMDCCKVKCGTPTISQGYGIDKTRLDITRETVSMATCYRSIDVPGFRLVVHSFWAYKNIMSL